MPRALLLLLLSAALVGACSRGGEEAARPTTASPGGPVAEVSDRSTFELEAPAIGEVGRLCLFRPRKDPIMIAYKDRTGAAWEGEVRVRDVPGFGTKWLSPSDKRVATVVARPRVDKFRARVDGNCRDAARGSYYSCTKVLEADVSTVRGFARGPTMAEASALAIMMCEKKVAEIVETSIEIKQENRDLHCRAVEQAWCDLPAAPPPPPVAKKK